MKNKLSIIIACYNEASHIQALLQKIVDTALLYNTEKEMVIIEDNSTDNSKTIINNFIHNNPGLAMSLVVHDKNKGKGACVRTGLQSVTGNIVIIQDADLEYQPEEYNRMLKPIIEGYADVVYGSRFRGSEPHRVLFFFHTIGNKFLTFLSNLFTQLNLTDMETGYKMFRTEILRSLSLKENRFGFEPEVTAKISRVKNIKIYEVGISYYGRGFEEGKKIRWYDGVRAIYCILKYNLFSRK